MDALHSSGGNRGFGNTVGGRRRYGCSKTRYSRLLNQARRSASRQPSVLAGHVSANRPHVTSYYHDVNNNNVAHNNYDDNYDDSNSNDNQHDDDYVAHNNYDHQEKNESQSGQTRARHI